MKTKVFTTFIVVWCLSLHTQLASQTRSSSLTSDTLSLPAQVSKWLFTEIKKSNRTSIDLESKDFFINDTSRLIGYIKGYTPKLGFNTGIIYTSNEITRENFPTVITIHEDGRFESDIPVNHPLYTYFSFGKSRVHFYTEPGQSLAIVLDAKDFSADTRDIKNVHYRGPAASINYDLLSVEINQPNYQKLNEFVKTQLPNEFLIEQTMVWKQAKAKLEQDLSKSAVSVKAQCILRNELSLAMSVYLFNYLQYRTTAARKDTANTVLKVQEDIGYYAFLKELPLDDQRLLIAPSFGTFINRFEYNLPFTRAIRPKSFHTYLFEDLSIRPMADDLEFITYTDDFHKKLSSSLPRESKDSIHKKWMERNTAFTAKYLSYQDGYRKRYPYVTPEDRPLWEWRVKDSLLTNVYGLKPGIIYQIAKVRTVAYTLKSRIKNKDSARLFLTALEQGISHPFIASEAERLFEKAYPPISQSVHDIPKGPGAPIFKKIIDQHKGKLLFVDFWATWCGPCVAYIKSSKTTRSKYDNNNDIEFVYITSDKDSPLSTYNNFVKDNNMTHSYRIPMDDYLKLRQLFKFNGIPRYVVISKGGKVLDDDFEMHNFENHLTRFLGKE